MTVTVREAIQQHRAKNGFAADGGVSLAYDWIEFGPFNFPIPNPGWRKRVIIYHDASHLLSGYGTDWQGEFDEGAYECGAGMGFLTPAWSFNLVSLVGAMVMRPRAGLAAFRRGRASKSVYATDLDALLERPFDEVQREMVAPEPKPMELADWGALALNLAGGLTILAAQGLLLATPVWLIARAMF